MTYFLLPAICCAASTSFGLAALQWPTNTKMIIRQCHHQKLVDEHTAPWGIEHHQSRFPGLELLLKIVSGYAQMNMEAQITNEYHKQRWTTLLGVSLHFSTGAGGGAGAEGSSRNLSNAAAYQLVCIISSAINPSTATVVHHIPSVRPHTLNEAFHYENTSGQGTQWHRISHTKIGEHENE